jgi:AraC-like DNA-binding protein
MLCTCCIETVKDTLQKNGIRVDHIKLGEATVAFDKTRMSFDALAAILREKGFELVVSREKKIVNKIKTTVVELIHHLNNVDSIVRKSDYLVEMTGMSYQQLSKIFSRHEPVTLERYIILNKIERIKELILHDEFTLSEIAYMMDYRSVQYLSSQFRKETGYTVSEYKKLELNLKKPLDNLYP